MCCRSGCPKFAHQYCQDQWGRKHSVQPYNVSYSLCREHHPQYCRYIEELNEVSNDKASDNGCNMLFAKSAVNEENTKQYYDEKQADDNNIESKQIFYDVT